MSDKSHESGTLRSKQSFDAAGDTTDYATDVEAEAAGKRENTNGPLHSPEPRKVDSEKDAMNKASNPPSGPPKAAWGGKPAPDGGLTAWLVILGAWCTSFCSFGWINGMFS